MDSSLFPDELLRALIAEHGFEKVSGEITQALYRLNWFVRQSSSWGNNHYLAKADEATTAFRVWFQEGLRAEAKWKDAIDAGA